MLFVQHFWSFDFAFCTSSQDLFFWSKYKVLGQFEGVLIFDSWRFVSFFCLGYFWCVYVHACVWICVYTVESKLENSSIYPSPSPNRKKTNLYILGGKRIFTVYFLSILNYFHCGNVFIVKGIMKFQVFLMIKSFLCYSVSYTSSKNKNLFSEPVPWKVTPNSEYLSCPWPH